MGADNGRERLGCWGQEEYKFNDKRGVRILV